MRLFSGLVGVIGAAIIAFFIGVLTQPPPDGNPIGYHLGGLVRLDQPPQLSCKSTDTNACNLQFDIYFDPSGTPKPSASCGHEKSCFLFHNVPGDNLGSKLTVTINEEVGDDITASGYAVGSIAGSSSSGN